LFFGVNDVGFAPPNVDDKAAGALSKQLAPTRRGSDVPILPKCNQQELLWLRGSRPQDIEEECSAPFAKKKFRGMRGTAAQLLQIQHLLNRYGWDDWDAPDTDEELLR
jgi:hypothetical protein